MLPPLPSCPLGESLRIVAAFLGTFCTLAYIQIALEFFLAPLNLAWSSFARAYAASLAALCTDVTDADGADGRVRREGVTEAAGSLHWLVEARCVR